MNKDVKPGDRVKAKRLGWNEPAGFADQNDLDPYDYPSDDLDGPLEVLEAGGDGVTPAYRNYVVAGQPADPATVEPIP